MANRTRTPLLTVLVLALSLAATACASRYDADAQTTDAGGAGLSGEIAISGSSTVEPISARVAQDFRSEHPGVSITVNGPGTGDGFQLFCAGEIAIAGASRPIAEEEAATCADNGIEYTELRVAIDGISVLTNPANDAVSCLSFADLYALTGPESEGFARWSDADALAAELEGTVAAPYPDAPLDLSGPGEESGTYDTFVELVIEDLAEQRGAEAMTRPDYNASPDDNTIIQGILGSDSSLGWVGYAFYTENRGQVKALEVAGEDGTCVAPSDETIASGQYPLSRPLFIYVNQQRAEDEAVRAFVDHYLSEAGLEAVSQAGYVQLSDEDWAETQAAWQP